VRGAAPLWEQLLLVLLMPPAMAFFFAVLARGWAGAVAGLLGTRVSDTTRKEQAWEFWFVLWACYAVAIGMFIYGHVIR